MPGQGTPAAQRPRGGTDAAASRPFGQSVERSFYCRSCRLTARGRWVPVGWYVLERAAGGGARHLRVGLYCSLDCLAAAGDDLAAAEQDAGARRGLPADAARDRARLLAQAGYVTDLAWENAAEGEAHRPVFTCAVTARVTGIADLVSACGRGGSKAAAKASAAAAFLAALARDDPGAAVGAPVTGAGLRPGVRSESQELRGDG